MSKTKSFIYKGKQSFSSSKLEQINRQFKQINKLDYDIQSNEIYLVLTKSNDINEEGIKDILSAKEYSEEFTFYNGPRLGTISPWSSKTEDIVKNVGLKDILRVERLFGFKINLDINPHKVDFSMFFDRMTQSIYFQKEEFQNLFSSDLARPLTYIDITEKGKKEIST